MSAPAFVALRADRVIEERTDSAIRSVVRQLVAPAVRRNRHASVVSLFKQD